MGFHDEALAEEAGNRITPALTRIVDAPTNPVTCVRTST